MKPPFIQSIKLTNFLSFGDMEAFPLRPLNVLIGANGSGKSNLLEAFELLRCTPGELASPINQGGGAKEWLWKGAGEKSQASLEVVVSATQPLCYGFSFRSDPYGRLVLVDEKIEDAGKRDSRARQPYFYYKFRHGKPVLNIKSKDTSQPIQRRLQRDNIDSEKSILAQRRDPDQYPELDYLARSFESMKLFREWTFGAEAALRQHTQPSQPGNFLLPDASNLAHVLSSFERTPDAKRRVVAALKDFYDGAENYSVVVESGLLQLYLDEGRFVTPASRLSDGTLRYLALLSILCHPKPPPVVCIEEPELGLHPDILPGLADLLKEASERTQLIVTTHSDHLVDALSDQPESVVVVEKAERGTTLSRLNADQLKTWLEDDFLGQLWRQGHLGGKRW